MAPRTTPTLPLDLYVEERRRGLERRSGLERREMPLGEVREMVPASEPAACVVCGHSTLTHSSFAVPAAIGEMTVHARCAPILARDILTGYLQCQLRPEAASPHSLSAREVQVLEGIVRGERDRETAIRLGIAEKTVKKHTAMVRKKLGVRSRTEAAMQAVALGIVVPSVHAS